MAFHTFNMFCLPDETLKEACETINLNLELKPDVVWSAIFQPYPGTKFFNEEIEKFIICKSFNRFKTNYYYTKDFPKIERLQKFFSLTIKYPFIKLFLPFLIRLPLDNLYDAISKLAWEILYSKSINKKSGSSGLNVPVKDLKGIMD